jgi:glycosyltransferase involved in cell wall biosynthesis
MSRPRLSICIATFNRARFIGQTLDSLIAQLTDEVEIVVLDGASTDSTEQVMREYAARCAQLRYIRGDTNNGIDRDFDRVVELASGEYCWLMSDDDLLNSGIVATVLRAIARQYSLIVVNAEVRSRDLSELLEERRLRFDADRVYAPNEMDRLFADAGAYLTFIGAVVIRREIWLERERAAYFGSLFIHVGVIFQRQLPADALVIAQPGIAIRYGQAMWKPQAFEIWMFKWPGLIRSLGGLSDELKNRLFPQEAWMDLKRLFFYRAKGAYTVNEYHRWISSRQAPRRKRLAARLIALLPGPLANGLAMLYLTFTYRDNLMLRTDARSSRYHFRNWFKV